MVVGRGVNTAYTRSLARSRNLGDQRMSSEFELETPSGLKDALRLLAEGNVTPLAGGTNLMIDLRAKRQRPSRIVALGHLDELRGIRFDRGKVVVGSRTTVTDLLRSPELAIAGPSLLDAARLFAGQMVRNAGTIGGNIACASPAADLVPALMSLDADITLASASGSRTVALADYFLGYKKDVRKSDELITQVSWTHPSPRTANGFYKLARRRGDAITVVGVAVTLSASDGKCDHARVALSAVSPCVIRATKAEHILQGQVPTAELIEAAAIQAAAQCSPIDDVRASAQYRRHAVHVLTRRLVSQIWSNLDQGSAGSA